DRKKKFSIARDIVNLFYNNRFKRDASSDFIEKKKRTPSGDKKKQHDRENFHEKINVSEQGARNFGKAFGEAWKAAN
ncbi:unnamed protein product, partial [Adineta steineri]